MPSSSILSSLSFRNVLLASIFIRVGLILYSEWHDARSIVKYTDVDYRVFTDAAAFLRTPGHLESNRAHGPLKQLFGWTFDFGDPYSRETYRYTPLLALILTPNEWLHPSFGKYIFALCDLINGWIIYQLLKYEILPVLERPLSTSSSQGDKSKKQPASSLQRREFLATAYSAVHLLNPLVFSISTRGSSESVLSLFVLITLYAAVKQRWDVAAVFLGLSTHWKIYPVIYGVGTLGVIGASVENTGTAGLSGFLSSIVNWRTIRFTVISAVTFFTLSAGCYAVWGYPFLYESYIYHLHRLDHRHNFSPYFYLTYLTYPSSDPHAIPEEITFYSKILRSPLMSFVPQMSLALGLGLLFGRQKRDLVFTWFLQTVVFVVFNKVCTSQYFLWYLLLLPLLLPQLSMSRWKCIVCIGVWVGTQALWLGEAYKLEFLGQNVFFGLWIRGLIYVLGNCWVTVEIMKAYDVHDNR